MRTDAICCAEPNGDDAPPNMLKGPCLKCYAPKPMHTDASCCTEPIDEMQCLMHIFGRSTTTFWHIGNKNLQNCTCDKKWCCVCGVDDGDAWNDWCFCTGFLSILVISFVRCVNYEQQCSSYRSHEINYVLRQRNLVPLLSTLATGRDREVWTVFIVFRPAKSIELGRVASLI